MDPPRLDLPRSGIEPRIGKKRNQYYNTPFAHKQTKLLPGNMFCPECNGTCIKGNAFCTNCFNGQVQIEPLTEDEKRS